MFGLDADSFQYWADQKDDYVDDNVENEQGSAKDKLALVMGKKLRQS